MMSPNEKTIISSEIDHKNNVQTISPIEFSPLLSDESEIHDEQFLIDGNEINPLHHIKTQVQVCVGRAVVTVGDLLGAKQGQVLQLDREVGEPIDLLIEGRVVARGHLVALNENFAVRISEVLQPMSLTSER